MNNTVLELSEQLAAAISESDEYKNFQKKYSEISMYPSLLREVNEFRRFCFALQNSTETDSMYEKVEEFRKKYEGLRSQRMVNEFLQSELCVVRMLQAVNRITLSGLDLYLDFLDN